MNKKSDIKSEKNAQEIKTALSREEIKLRSFFDLFKSIDIEDISESVFNLIIEDHAVLTAGNPSHFNSMLANWKWGILFHKPVVYSFINPKRYTLELMRKEQKFTLSYFNCEFQDDILLFGKMSARHHEEKMKNTKLTSIQTPTGNMAFKEAKLIIECDLVHFTDVPPDFLFKNENKKFAANACLSDTNDYHNIVYGAITNVWSQP